MKKLTCFVFLIISTNTAFADVVYKTRFNRYTGEPDFVVNVASLTLSDLPGVSVSTGSLASDSTNYIQNRYLDSGVQSSSAFHVSSGTTEGSLQVFGPILIDTPTVSPGFFAGRSAMSFNPTNGSSQLTFRSYDGAASSGGVLWKDSSGNSVVAWRVPPQLTGVFSIQKSSDSVVGLTDRYLIYPQGKHQFNNASGTTIVEFDPIANSSFTIPIYASSGTITQVTVSTITIGKQLRDATGGAGISGQVYTSNGSGLGPTWQTLSAGGGGYSVQPATVAFQLNQGMTASTITTTGQAIFGSSVTVQSSMTVTYQVSAASFSGVGTALTLLNPAAISAGLLGPSVIASSHNATGATAGNYGSATQVPGYTVGGDGRLSSASNTTILISTSNLNATGTASNVTFLRGDNTWSTPAGGGASWFLGVTTGNINGFTGNLISTPTYIVVFDSNVFNGQLTGSNTYFASIKASSVTLQGNSFNGANQLLQLSASSLVPNANVDSSSVTKQGNVFNGATQLVQTSASSLITNTLIDGSSITKQGLLLAGSNITLTPSGGTLTIAASASSGTPWPVAFTTGTSAGFTGLVISSGAQVVVFDSNTTNGQLTSSNTYFFSLKASSVTLLGQNPPAASIAAGSLGSSVLASSITATGVLPGSYVHSSITVDAQGRISSASNGSVPSSIAFTTGTSAGFTGNAISSAPIIVVFDSNTTSGQLVASSTYFFSLKASSVTLLGPNPAASFIAAGTLGTSVIASSASAIMLVSSFPVVNPNVGSFTNTSLTVDAYGRITAASTGSGSAAPTSSFLAVGTGTASGYTTNVTSPTAIVNFLGDQFRTLATNNTAYISLNQSSVTVQGNLFNGASQLAKLDANSLIGNSNIDSSSVTKQGNAFNSANKLVQLDANGAVNLSSGTLTQFYASTVTIGSGSTLVLPDAPVDITGNVNTFLQLNLQNRSNGANASGDIVVTNDIGSNTAGFINMGINSSGYSQSTFNIVSSSGGYLYTSDGPLAIGSAGPNPDHVVKLFAGGTTASNLKMQVDASSVTTFARLSIAKGIYPNGDLKSADYVITSTDTVILASATFPNTRTITLPAASTANDQLIAITKVDISSAPVLIKRAGSDLIVGATQFYLYGPGQSLNLQSDGISRWFPVGAAPKTPPYIGFPADPNSAAIVTASSTYCSATYTPDYVSATGVILDVGAQALQTQVAIYDAFGTIVSTSAKTTIGTGKVTITLANPAYLSPGTNWICFGSESATTSVTRRSASTSALGECSFATSLPFSSTKNFIGCTPSTNDYSITAIIGGGIK